MYMIKMLVSTYYRGKRYDKDSCYPVDIDTELRWLKNKIAAKEQESEEKFADMSDEDLRNYASANSIPIPGNVSKRDTIINIILQHERNKKEG